MYYLFNMKNTRNLSGAYWMLRFQKNKGVPMNGNALFQYLFFDRMKNTL